MTGAAFAAGVAAIFRDPNVATDGSLAPAAGGGPIACRVILYRPDAVQGWNGVDVVTDSVRLEFRAAEVGDLARGDQVTIDGVTYEITSEPTRGADRLVWATEAREVA